jgi:hypothetical protein
MPVPSVNWGQPNVAAVQPQTDAWAQQFQMMMSMSQQRQGVLAQNHARLQAQAAQQRSITPPYQSMLFPYNHSPVPAPV